VAILPVIHEQWRRREVAMMIGCALVAALPWFVIWPVVLHAQSPELFATWFWDNQVGRFLGTNALGPPSKPVHYLTVLPWFTLPALPLVLYAVIARTETLRRDPSFVAMVVLFVITLAVLSASRTARQLYALPLLVPLAIAAVPGLRALPHRWATAIYRFEGVLFALLLVAVWVLAMALFGGMPASLHDRLTGLRPGYDATITARALAAAAAYTAAWVAALVALRRHPDRAAYGWTIGLTAAWGAASCFFLGWVDAGKTYRPVVTAIAEHVPDNARCVASADLGEPQRAMLHYSGGIRTRRVEVDEDAVIACDYLLVQYRGGVSILRPGADWELIWQGTRMHDRSDSFGLYRKKR
jgi:4-amino-4-deoxy-L-arabinose transferase-like glycosyltransferase